METAEKGLGRYRLENLLGEGGMGRVFRAYDRDRGETVALKFLHPNFSRRLFQFFQEEVKLLSRLSHPNLLKIFDFHSEGEEDPFFSMEYLSGYPLQDLPRDLPPQKWMDLFVELAQGLHYLHCRNILHRDLKPSNIMVTDSRLKILDFGLSGSFKDSASSPKGLGTLSYLPPEAFWGEYGIPGDLFSVGVLFYEVLTGRLPFEKPLSLSSAKREVPPALKTLRPDLPDSFCDLIHRLLDLNPSRRPHSALSLIRFLNQHVEKPYELAEEEDYEATLQKAPLVGREREVQFLKKALQHPPVFVEIKGPTGIGRTRLLEEMKWRFQLAGTPYLVFDPSESNQWLSLALARMGQTQEKDEDPLLQARLFFAKVGATPTVLALRDLHEWPPTDLKHLRLFLAMALRTPSSLAILLEFDSDLIPQALSESLAFLESATKTVLLSLQDLSPQESRELISQAAPDSSLPETLKEEIVKSSGGRPLLLLEALRNALTRKKGEKIEGGAAPRTFQEVSAIRVARLSPSARNLLSFIVTHPHPVPLTEALELWGGEIDSLQDALLELDSRAFTSPRRTDQPSLMLAHPSLRQVYGEVLPREILREAHGRWVSRLLRQEGETPQASPAAILIADHAFEAGDIKTVKAWGLAAAEMHQKQNQEEEALRWYERLLPLAETDFERCVIHAHEAPLFYRLGRYEEALTAYDRWFALREDDASRLQKVKHLFYTGLVLYTSGQEENAAKRLQESLEAGDSDRYPAHRPYHARALSLLAAFHEKAGEMAQARELLEKALLLAAENPVLLGEIEQRLGTLEQISLNPKRAWEHFQKSLEHFEKAGNVQAQAIALNSLGMLHRDCGRLKTALETMEQALQQAKRGGETLQRGRYEENRGLVYLDLAEYGKAHEGMENARDLLEALGQEEDRFLADLHQADLLLRLGNWDRCDIALARLESQKESASGKESLASLFLLQAEKNYLSHHFQAAQDCFERVLTSFPSVSLNLLARIGLFRCRIRMGKSSRQAEEESRLLIADLQNKDFPWTLWSETLDFFGKPSEGLGEADVKNLLRRIRTSEKPEERMDLYGLLAVDLKRRGFQKLAQKFWDAARTEWEKISNTLPEEFKMDFEKNRDLKSLDESLDALLPSEKTESPSPAPPRPPSAPTTQIPENRFRQFSEINRQIAQKNDLSEILERVMDAAIVLTGAERGFLLLKSEGRGSGPIQGFEVKSARHINHRSLKEEELQFSMTAIKQAVDQGAYVLTDNAQLDPRFHEKKSVAQFSLKSILSVPLESEGRILGAIYLDHRYQPECFSDEDVVLLNAFASQAALAIQKAQMMDDLKKAKAKLEEQVETQAKKIETLSGELSQVRDQLKYGYEEIVGQSPGMMKVFQLLDHVTETTIPVWIRGESGTGKELVARSLHFNSPRKGGPFVTENVSAIPETLLESEMFGHKKGAFTHADRDRIGLFEQAHNGTLFLDEVADMSLAMQAKLLRVLQEGEIRPLGSNKKVKIDVRLVTASNKDLNQLVKEEKFRQDLFFRINGLTIPLPPLRERKEDIPLLVAYLIKKISRDFQLSPSEVSDEAMDRLLRHRWPGNIRELEKVIRNALLFAKGRVIVPEFLGLEEGVDLAGAPMSGTVSSARAEEQSEERQMILDSLRRHQMNKEEVAKELEISLRSLYTRMEKLGIPKKKTVLGKYLGLK